MNRKGFTLIELMIVVVIIGILAALAIPRFLEASKKAKVTEGKGVVKQLYTLQQTFYQESGHFPLASGNLPITDFNADWTCKWAAAPAMLVAESINFDMPTGKPRFCYFLDANGGAHAEANAQDASLAGTTVTIDATGSMSSLVP